MKVITRGQIDKKILSELKNGKIFVYPTDTIYGIGCNAGNERAVKKIREIKQRDKNPFSIIVPSKKWVEERCLLSNHAKSWLKKLPGPYTLILKLKNNKDISAAVNANTGAIGVRIPNNWFAQTVKQLKIPFVTTSVNVAGEKPITSLKDLDESMKEHIDYFIDDGILEEHPSTLVKLLEGKEEIIKR